MFRHSKFIKQGVKGEISKIHEEIEEFEDANTKLWKLVELTDIVLATSQVSRRQFRVPFLLIVIFAYLRWVYKPIRNLCLDLLGYPKSYFLMK